MKEIVVLRGPIGRCREHWRRFFGSWPFFDDTDKAVKFLGREKLPRAVVYARGFGREASLAAMGYFIRTELVS